VQIPPLSPRRNAYAQRFARTARTKVTDRMLILGERHLRVVMAKYQTHYNRRRTRQGRQLHPSRPGHPAADLAQKRVMRRTEVPQGYRAAEETVRISYVESGWAAERTSSKRLIRLILIRRPRIVDIPAVSMRLPPPRCRFEPGPARWSLAIIDARQGKHG